MQSKQLLRARRHENPDTIPALQAGDKNNVYPTVFLACPQGVTLTPLQAALWTSHDVAHALDKHKNAARGQEDASACRLLPDQHLTQAVARATATASCSNH